MEDRRNQGAKRRAIGEEFPPMAGDSQKCDVAQSVGHPEPGDREMHPHAFSETVMEMEGLVEPVGKEARIKVIGPVNQGAAPDHQEQERKVEPMSPSKPK